MTLAELSTLRTPFLEMEQQHAHQKTYANIMGGRYAKTYAQEYHSKLEARTASVLDELMIVDPAMRLGGERRGAESLRVHPFFWGLSWEGLERRQLRPPHAELAAKQAATKTFVPTASSTPKLAGSPLVRPSPKKAQDAASLALDKMFDFSHWDNDNQLR